MCPFPIVLASASPRRRSLLRQLGLSFRVIRPDVDEDGVQGSPRRVAMKLAALKAESVAARVRGGLIIGVDTIVVLGQEIMGKPRSKADARRMLTALSGRTHRVICGLCLLRVPGGERRVVAETTRVKFRDLSRREIDDYIATPEPYDKAGAYAIQGRAGFFVERIEGDYYNIVGLPVARLLRLLAMECSDSYMECSDSFAAKGNLKCGKCVGEFRADFMQRRNRCTP